MVYNALKRIEKNKPITNLNLTLKEIDYIIKGLFWVLDTSKNKKVDDLINRFIDIKINQKMIK